MNSCRSKLHRLSIHKSSNSVHGCGKGGAGYEIINDYNANTPHQLLSTTD
jgi:hypothetical protein